MKPVYLRFSIRPSNCFAVSKATPITINKLVPPKPIDCGKFQIICAKIGNNATSHKNRAPTVLKRMNSFETYSSVPLPGRTLGI